MGKDFYDLPGGAMLVTDVLFFRVPGKKVNIPDAEWVYVSRVATMDGFTDLVCLHFEDSVIATAGTLCRYWDALNPELRGKPKGGPK